MSSLHRSRVWRVPTGRKRFVVFYCSSIRLLSGCNTQTSIKQELFNNTQVSDDFCLKGGLARIGGVAVVVMGTVKGHTPGDMQAANYGELVQGKERERGRRACRLAFSRPVFLLHLSIQR